MRSTGTSVSAAADPRSKDDERDRKRIRQKYRDENPGTADRLDKLSAPLHGFGPEVGSEE